MNPFRRPDLGVAAGQLWCSPDGHTFLVIDQYSWLLEAADDYFERWIVWDIDAPIGRHRIQLFPAGCQRLCDDA